MPAKPGRRPLSGYTIEEAAYHEAGHAVLALACQATVRRATIKPRGALRGRVIFDSHLGPKADLMMLIALAGPFAQRRFAPKSDWIAPSDFNSVLKAIFDKGSERSPEKRQKSLEYIVDHAEQAVAFFWSDIKVAARALLTHETLTGDELAAAIRAARRKTRRRFRIGDPPAFALAPLRAARDRRGHRLATNEPAGRVVACACDYRLISCDGLRPPCLTRGSASQAWHRCRSDQRGQIYGAEEGSSLTGMEYVPS
jgi:hypothetical protein